MSDGHDPAVLEGLVGRLEQAAAQLREGELEPEQAAAVVDACAQHAAQASGELERLTRAAASEPAPGQDRLV